MDWYTILVGILALLALVMHGGLWVQMKASGEVSSRAGKLAAQTCWGVVVLTALVTPVTFRVQPQILANFSTWPWGFVFPLLAVAGLAGVLLRCENATNAEPSLPLAPI